MRRTSIGAGGMILLMALGKWSPEFKAVNSRDLLGRLRSPIEGASLYYVIGGVVVVLAVVFFAMLPDLLRYMKIRAM